MVASFTHAIILGGGIAGLLAARVLIEHCERITIIERDQYPATPTFRPGTPQARQIHNMLLRGQHVLDALFPGFSTKMVAAGARPHDFASESLYFYGTRCPRLSPGLPGWKASRMLVEWQIRQEMQQFSQIHWLQECRVVGLLFEDRAVRGVHYQKRGSRQHPRETLQGDLVIDASGSSSAAPRWLQEIGYPPPQEEHVNPYIGYATRLYQPPEQAPATWWRELAIQGTGPNRRGGAVMPVEGGHWMVLLAGTGKEYPPTDPEAFLAFAHSLPEPTLYESIKKATALSPIYGYRPVGNRFRHYERCVMPSGFLVMGDAMCTFNPIYGQGMTVAALEAELLDRCVRTWQQRRDPIRHFHQQMARLLATPWMLATTADSSPQDRKTLREKLNNWYVAGQVLPAIPRDIQVERTFLEIVQMLRSPNALLHPAILFRVLHSSRH